MTVNSTDHLEQQVSRGRGKCAAHGLMPARVARLQQQPVLSTWPHCEGDL